MTYDNELNGLLMKQIQMTLESEWSWRVNRISLIGQGVVNAVYLVEEHSRGIFAIRTPWRAEENRKDRLESGEISLKKEYQIAKHCNAYGFPVPEMYHLYLGEKINFLIYEYIDGIHEYDNTVLIGEKIFDLHQLSVENLSIIDQNNQSLTNIISTRIEARLHYINNFFSTSFLIPSQCEVEKILNTSTNPNVLMHLDVRPPNIFMKHGEIKAIIDWDNAFIGDPIMELMRIFESKELVAEEFMEGYRDSKLLERTEPIIQWIYRLDTTLMLTILFSTFIKEKEKSTYYMNRTNTLLSEITKRM